jgi:hypothetical protein
MHFWAHVNMQLLIMLQLSTGHCVGKQVAVST